MLEIHVCNRSGALIRAFAVGDRDEIVVGRDPQCDIHIDADDVAPKHCRLRRDRRAATLRDLGAPAGMLVNGDRVDEIRVVDGLEVQVGPALLRFVEGA